MTDIEKKALALVNEVQAERGGPPYFSTFRRSGSSMSGALCRAVEQREAAEQKLQDFRQEVSDAVSQYADEFVPADLQRFIITKPDPLVEAMADCGVDRFESWADQLRAALAARGLKIVESE